SILMGSPSGPWHHGWDITVCGKVYRGLVCLSVSTDINLLEAISFLAEIILCIDTPRAPLATIKLQFHRRRANKREPRAASTDMRLIGPIRYIRSRCLVRFRPHDASRARFAGKDAFPRLRGIIDRNNANGDFEVVLDLFFDFARPVPVRQGETTVDFRFSAILRRKEIVEVFSRIDHLCVYVAELFRARMQRIL